MAVTNFIPEIWSAKLLDHLDKVHVYASLFNRDYEGEIANYGDTVKINQLGDITVSDYEGSLGEPEELDGDQRILVIDKAKYFNFKIDDVDNAQTNPKLMEEATQRASYAMNDAVDSYLGGLLAAEGTAVNADPVTPTAANAYGYLVDLGTALSEANVPMLGRWVVVPPWYHGLLLKDDRFVGNGTDPNMAMLQGGLVGSAAGFQIHLSNNVPLSYTYAKTTDTAVSSGKTYYTLSNGQYTAVASPAAGSLSSYYERSAPAYKIVAGTNAAGSYAEQLIKMEALRAQSSFSDIIRGLHVFGAKVVQPKAAAVLTANRG